MSPFGCSIGVPARMLPSYVHITTGRVSFQVTVLVEFSYLLWNRRLFTLMSLIPSFARPVIDLLAKCASMSFRGTIPSFGYCSPRGKSSLYGTFFLPSMPSIVPSVDVTASSISWSLFNYKLVAVFGIKYRHFGPAWFLRLVLSMFLLWTSSGGLWRNIRHDIPRSPSVRRSFYI